MHEEQTLAIEGLVRTACERADYQSAATAVFEGYGAEIYSFVAARFHGQLSSADEAFSEFSEDFWRGLPSFQWRCSIRAWCYKLARSALSRQARSPQNQRDRRLPLSAVPWLNSVVDRTRTTTQPHLRTDVKDEFQRLREKLSTDDQDLLILRVERELSWKEIAHAMLENGTDDDELRRMEAALRQRFSDVKRRLRRLATEAGLLE
jgi:RNA polymerase sigma factor (sigma-70 family)